ncbi:MAG TPA: hypothetical protein DEQ44_04685, partial [Flavobacteriaceae bacterium]|nr:hypothetical protein [Flavobacteriaceae bacterium]
KAAQYRWSEAQWLAEDQEQKWVLARQEAIARYQQALSAWESINLSDQYLGDELSKSAEVSYRTGAIDFWQYAMIQDQALQSTLEYLQLQWQLDQAVLALNYPDDTL